MNVFEISSNGKKYIKLKNSNGKIWLFDLNNMNFGLCLYQPSSTKGRIIKKTLEIASNSFIIKRLLRAQKYEINNSISAIICDNFNCNTDKLKYDIFFGTPGIHKKMVIQISDDDKILGYCKVSESLDVYNLFLKEKELLMYLHSCGVKNIPYVLSVNKINNEFVYCQTTEKTVFSKAPIEYNDLINDFLVELYRKTERSITYKESNLYQNIHNLHFGSNKKYFEEKYTEYLNFFDSQIGDEQMKMAVSHRDFTPWNMFIESGKVFVFDWEYSSDAYFPMMDLFHFVIQSKIMDVGSSANEIIKFLELNCKILSSYLQKVTNMNMYLILLSYLLDFVALYISRSDSLSSAEIYSVKIRLDIMEYAFEKISN